MPTFNPQPGAPLNLAAMGVLSGSTVVLQAAEYGNLTYRPSVPVSDVTITCPAGRATIRGDTAHAAADIAGPISGLSFEGVDFKNFDRDSGGGITVSGVVDSLTFNDCSSAGARFGLYCDAQAGAITRLAWYGGSIENCGACGIFMSGVYGYLYDGLILDRCGGGDPDKTGRPWSQTHGVYHTYYNCNGTFRNTLAARCQGNGFRGYDYLENVLALDCGSGFAAGPQSRGAKNCWAALFHDPDPANGITQGGGFGIGAGINTTLEQCGVSVVRGCTGGHWAFGVHGDQDASGKFQGGFRYTNVQLKSCRTVTEDGAFGLNEQGYGRSLVVDCLIGGVSPYAIFDIHKPELWQVTNCARMAPSAMLDPTRDPRRWLTEIKGTPCASDAESVQMIVDLTRQDRTVPMGLVGWMKAGTKPH